MINIYHALFEKEKDALPGAHHENFANARSEALAKFLAQGWPTRKHDAWKYTSTHEWQQEIVMPQNNSILHVGQKKETSKTDDAKAKAPAMHQPKNNDYTLCLIDGIFSKENSHLPDIIELSSFTDNIPDKKIWSAQPNDSALVLLNHVFWQTGLTITLRANTTLDKPLHIQSWQTQKNTTSFAKLMFHFEENSQAEIILEQCHCHQDDKYFNNLVIHTTLEKNARCHWITQHNTNKEAFYFFQHNIYQQSQSSFHEKTISTEARWLRHELNIHLQKEHAKCELFGAYHGKEKSHLDHHLNIFHEHSHCESHQFYKGIVDDQSHVVFNGKVTVAKQAQKSIAHQKNDTILLSAHAEMDTKPELEIYADDVICSHGATVGALDESALFFLCSRGMSEQEAKQMLLDAFMQEVYDV